MSYRIDTSELDRLAVDFSEGPNRVQRQSPKVLERSARRVRESQRRDATGHRQLAELPGTVGSDRVGLLEYEVGFDKRGQGNLANILVYGSVNNSPIMKSPVEHALRDVPSLLQDVADMAEGATLAGD